MSWYQYFSSRNNAADKYRMDEGDWDWEEYPDLAIQLGFVTEEEYETWKAEALAKKAKEVAALEEPTSSSVVPDVTTIVEDEGKIETAEDVDFGMGASSGVVDSYFGSCNTGNSVFEWYSCLKFFGINIDEYKRQIANKPTEGQHVRVPFKKLPGMSVGLFDYQLMGVYNLIKLLVNDISGGFLSDEQGLGKTQEMFGLIALAHNLRKCRAEVLGFWSSKSKSGGARRLLGGARHHPTADSGARSCPYDSKYGFRCYCYNEQTRDIADRLPEGPNVVVAPARSCAPLMREAKTKLDTRTLKIRGYGKDVEHGSQVSSRDIAMCIATIKAKVRPGQVELEYSYQAGLGQSDYIIFVSPDSIDKLNAEFNILVKGKKKSAFLPGIVMLDEFHEYAMNLDSRTLAWLNHLKKCTVASQQATPLVYFVSGTPIDQSPADLSGPINLLERPEIWSERFHPLQAATHDRLVELITNFNTYVHLQSQGKTVDPEHVKDYYHQLSQILQNLMVRRLVTDSFQSRPLTNLGPLKISIIAHPVPAKYRRSILTLQSTMQSLPPAEIRSHPHFLPLLLSSTFPAILSTTSYANFKFTPAEVISFPLNPAQSPYLPFVPSWIAASKKLQSILSAIVSMLSDSCPIPGGPSNLKKLCLFSPHEAETLILYLWLSTKRSPSELRPVYLHPALPQAEKQKLIDRFLAEGHNSPNVLVSSFKTGGTGLNLQRASYLIVSSPGWSRRETAQVFGRIHRVGQKATRLRMELLVTEGHWAEEAVVLQGWGVGGGGGGLRGAMVKEDDEDKEKIGEGWEDVPADE